MSRRVGVDGRALPPLTCRYLACYREKPAIQRPFRNLGIRRTARAFNEGSEDSERPAAAHRFGGQLLTAGEGVDRAGEGEEARGEMRGHRAGGAQVAVAFAVMAEVPSD